MIMKSAVYPAFDPITLGHLSIIRRAAAILTLYVRHDKLPRRRCFPVKSAWSYRRCVRHYERRRRIVRRAFGRIRPQQGRTVIVKGRAVSTSTGSFRWRWQTGKSASIDTLFLASSEKYTYLSSTVVKEMIRRRPAGIRPAEIITTLSRYKAGGEPMGNRVQELLNALQHDQRGMGHPLGAEKCVIERDKARPHR